MRKDLPLCKPGLKIELLPRFEELSHPQSSEECFAIVIAVLTIININRIYDSPSWHLSPQFSSFLGFRSSSRNLREGGKEELRRP